MPESRSDLDLADLAELRRRVVDPVLTELFRDGELTSADLSFTAPDEWWSRREPAGPWLRLAVSDEVLDQRIGKMGFWLEDAAEVAGELEGVVTDWICESGFGWGQLRELPAGWCVPEPPADARGRRTITVHFGERGDVPLWEAGRLADPSSLGLSPDLSADLRAWQEIGERIADAMEATEAAEFAAQMSRLSESGQGGAYASGMQVISQAEWETREAAAVAMAETERCEHRRWVERLEPLRDELVERLRAELGPSFLVPTPPRIP